MCAFSRLQISGNGFVTVLPSGEVDAVEVVENIRTVEDPEAVIRAVGVGVMEKMSVGCAEEF